MTPKQSQAHSCHFDQKIADTVFDQICTAMSSKISAIVEETYPPLADCANRAALLKELLDGKFQVRTLGDLYTIIKKHGYKYYENIVITNGKRGFRVDLVNSAVTHQFTCTVVIDQNDTPEQFEPKMNSYFVAMLYAIATIASGTFDIEPEQEEN